MPRAAPSTLPPAEPYAAISVAISASSALSTHSSTAALIRSSISWLVTARPRSVGVPTLGTVYTRSGRTVSRTSKPSGVGSAVKKCGHAAVLIDPILFTPKGEFGSPGAIL
jgi:hypothetical protein